MVPMQDERNDSPGGDNGPPTLRVAAPPTADDQPRCAMCGAERLTDKEGYCSYCRRRIAELDIGQVEAKLAMVEATVRAAIDSLEVPAVHPDDVRERVERVLAGISRHHPARRASTLKEMHAELYHGLGGEGEGAS
jgi:hypothetical protein